MEHNTSCFCLFRSRYFCTIYSCLRTIGLYWWFFLGLICLSLVSFHLTGFFSLFAAGGFETHSVFFLDLPRSPAKNIPLFWLSLYNCSLRVQTHTKQKTCIHNSWFMWQGVFLHWVIFSCHPTLSCRKGTWSFTLISILSSMCVCESMSKLESRSCNNMPSYSLLMPIGDSVSHVLSCVCFFVSASDICLWSWVSAVYQGYPFMCVCVHVLWGCWQCILHKCACTRAASLWIISVCCAFFLMQSLFFICDIDHVMFLCLEL